MQIVENLELINDKIKFFRKVKKILNCLMQILMNLLEFLCFFYFSYVIIYIITNNIE